MYVRPGHKSGCIVRRGGLAFSPSSSLGLARERRPQTVRLGPLNGIYAAQIFLVRVSASSLSRSLASCRILLPQLRYFARLYFCIYTLSQEAKGAFNQKKTRKQSTAI